MSRTLRKFGTSHKLHILAEVDACKSEKQVSAILKREQIDRTYLTRWRKQLNALNAPTKEIVVSSPTSKLQKENEDLKQQLSRMKIIIEIQKLLTDLIN
jgi:transposase-like protein